MRWGVVRDGELLEMGVRLSRKEIVRYLGEREVRELDVCLAELGNLVREVEELRVSLLLTDAVRVSNRHLSFVGGIRFDRGYYDREKTVKLMRLGQLGERMSVVTGRVRELERRSLVNRERISGLRNRIDKRDLAMLCDRFR